MLVIALAAATALVALRATEQQVRDTRQIDHRLTVLHDLRADTRELGLSARRYILSGDRKERLRIQAIVAATYPERQKIRTGSQISEVERAIDEYAAALSNVLEINDENPILRLSRFEDELARIRGPLSMAFDEALSRDRARQHAVGTPRPFTSLARSMIMLAAALGVGLALAVLVLVLRRLAERGAPRSSVLPESDPTSPPSIHPSMLG